MVSDQATDLIDKLKITPANVNDCKAECDVVPDNPGQTYADSAYRGPRFRQVVQERGGIARVVVTSVWSRSVEDARKKQRTINTPIHKVWGQIEKIFGTCKRSCGMDRMPHRGLDKAKHYVELTAVVTCR